MKIPNHPVFPHTPDPDEAMDKERDEAVGEGLIAAAEPKCAYCGGRADGNYAIHRDGFCEGPEVDLCDACGYDRFPTCPEIWAKISLKST